jgi:signal transduction histidine kinase
MHDQFGQQLTALILKLGMLKEDCGEQKRLCEQVDALEEVARQLDWDVDFLVWELRPTALDDLGLQDALSNYAQNWSQHVGVPVDVHTGGMGKVRLTSEIEITLYRIAQEALNNVAKHARAASASILLERHTDTISLIVEDDGIGFEADNTSAGNDKGLGLVGIRERAALVGGTVEIESHPGDGTTVYVRIPAPLVALKGERHE